MANGTRGGVKAPLGFRWLYVDRVRAPVVPVGKRSLSHLRRLGRRGGGDSASSSVVKTRNYDESYEEDGTSAMISVCLVRRVTVFYR